MRKLICLLTIVCTLLACSTIVYADGTTTLTLNVPDPEKASYTLTIPENQSIEYKGIENPIGTVKVTDSENFAENQAVKVKLAYTGEFASETTETTLPVSVQFEAIGPGTSRTIADIGAHADNTIMFTNKGNGHVNETGTITMKSEPYNPMPLDHLLLFINEPAWTDNPLDPGTYTMGITFTSEIVTN